eukprot:m.509433 g.509433  ORF g.509433 m.509433 type:complete len:319 (+) comp21889_c0_seq4:1576-2532(+)
MRTAAVTKNGNLYTWGNNNYGQLGLGHREPCPQPTLVDSLVGQVGTVSMGSMYCGAVLRNGRLAMWGHGGHGNLGLGDRKDRTRPCTVGGLLSDAVVVQVACTRGQNGCKGGRRPKTGGAEGPHTIALTAHGRLYTFGTCHKGVLLNLGSKTGAFGEPWDELEPYRVGSGARNDADHPPLSPAPLSVWPPEHYGSVGPFRWVVSGHIHAAACSLDGTAWAWGCGSNDGRAGVERFLNARGDAHPPSVDAMKCYMMNPHRIGVARRKYWEHDTTAFSNGKVVRLATGRNHMAAIVNARQPSEDCEREPSGEDYVCSTAI